MQAMPREVLFWGASGQAIVNRPIVEHGGGHLVALIDDTPGLRSPFPDVPIYEGERGLRVFLKGRDPSRIGFSVAIGNPHGRIRLKLHDLLVLLGLMPIPVVHPSAVIASDVVMAEGVQIMAGAVIQPRVRIGRQCIVNTKASVDHECVLEEGSEAGPGATLAGCVTLEAGAWVASGAVVLPRRRIGVDAIVGAGAVVTHDVAAGAVVVGVPARPMGRRDRKVDDGRGSKNDR